MKKEGLSNSAKTEDQLKKENPIFGGGEMGDRIRAFDWSKTSMGPLHSWSPFLHSAVNLMLLSTAPLVILWGKEGITLYNNAYAAFAGKRHPDLLGNSFPNVWPKAADFIRNIIDKTLQGESLSYKSLLFTVNRNNKAEDIWMDLDCSPLLDENAKPYGTFIVNTETTHYVETFRQLKENEQRLKLILEGSADGFYEFNVKTQTSEWSKRLREILGYHQEEERQAVDFDFLLSLIHPEDRARIEAAINRTISEGVLYDEEYRIQHRKGHYIYLHSKGKLISDQHGKPIGIAGTANDITGRKQMEEALKASEERFRIMAEAAGILVAQTDETGSAVYFNQEWLKLTGRSMQELLDEGWAEFLHPDDREDIIPAFKKAFEKREVLKKEFRFLSKGDEYRWQLAVVSPCFSPNGTFTGYVSSCVDVSDLRWTEERLAYQNRLTSIITDNATVGLFMMDAQGRTTFMNPAAEKISGFTFEEARGEVLHDLTHHLHPDGSPFPMEDCTIGQTIFSLGQLKNHEDIFIHKDGSFYPVLCSASAIWENETLKGLILEVQDISERKQAEEALKESEERFRIMADAAPYVVWSLNPDASIRYVNKFGLEFIGNGALNFMEGNWEQYIHPDDLAPSKHQFLEAFQHKEVISFENRFLRHDGEYRWILTQGAPSYYPDGRLFGYVGSCIDISDWKEAEKALEAKNAQLLRINNDLDNFIYTASHDLKAPIHNIEGLVNVLQNNLVSESLNNPKVKLVMGMMQQSIDKFKTTIKDLAEIAKIESSKEEVVSEVYFREILEEVMLNIKSQIEDANASISVDFAKAPSIHFARKNLRSILYNLLSNAIKYRSPKRPAQVRISAVPYEHEYILLTVQDNGLGIKEADKSKVFTMFKRLHQHVEGTGVGMSIVKRIIENHGGRIEVESVLEKGSSFKVYFKNPECVKIAMGF